MKASAGILLTCLSLALAAPTFSTDASSDAPQIPGLTLMKTWQGICPRQQPMEMDLNGDGQADYIFAGNQKGKFHEYLPPEQAGQLGIIGVLVSAKAYSSNKNFSSACAVDGRTGQILWEFQAGGLITQSVFSPDGGRLYLASHDNHVYALDTMTGHVSWSCDLGGKVVGLSVGASEAIVLTVHNGLAAIGLSKGEKKWELPVKVPMEGSEWGYFFTDGDRLFISCFNGRILCVNRTTGAILWTHSTECKPSLRVQAKGLLVFADGSQLVALDAVKGEERWRYETRGRPQLEPIWLFGDFLVSFNGYAGSKARLFTLEFPTGRERWSIPLQKIPRENVRVILVPEDENLYRTYLAARLSESGRPVALFLADRSNVYSLDAETGAVRWSAPIRDAQFLSLQGERVLVQDRKDNLTAFKAASGDKEWTRRAGGQLLQTATVGNILLGTEYSHSLLALEVSSGNVMFEDSLTEPLWLAPWKGDRALISSGGKSWVFGEGIQPPPAPPVPGGQP